jgi:hypothetical protein
VPGSRLAAFPLAVALSGLGLALAGCGPSSSAASGSGSPASAATTATATASAATTSAAPTPAAAAGGKPACPTAAAISAAAGTTYQPLTSSNSGGTLGCGYEGNAAILNITFTTVTTPPSDLSVVAGAQASAQGGGKFTAVSGVGDAAYTFTPKRATNPPSSVMLLQSGSRLITIAGAGDIGQIKAIARAAIAS